MAGVAVLHAIDAYRNPSRYGSGKEKSLPEGMLDVIKIAAGDTSTADKFRDETQETVAFLVEASRHYLLLLLLDPRAQGARLLALNPGASPDNIKDHKRWILKWLHPDRNPSKWESSLFTKISTLDLKAVAEPAKIEPAQQPNELKLQGKGRNMQRLRGLAEHRAPGGKTQGNGSHVGKLHAAKSPAMKNYRQGTGKPRWKMVLNIKPIMATFGFAVGFLLGIVILVQRGTFSFVSFSGWLK